MEGGFALEKRRSIGAFLCKWELIQHFPPFRALLHCPLKVPDCERDITADPKGWIFDLGGCFFGQIDNFYMRQPILGFIWITIAAQFVRDLTQIVVQFFQGWVFFCQ